MFGKAHSLCVELSLRLWTSTLIFCIFTANNATFAQNLGVDDNAIDASENGRFSAKIVTYETFLLAHTLDPGNTVGYPFTTHDQWFRWFREREEKHTEVYNATNGRPPKPKLTGKNANTIVITAPAPILNDFPNGKKGKNRWSNHRYSVVLYKSYMGQNPRFFECPGNYYVLAAVDDGNRPKHFEDFCNVKGSEAPQYCWRTINCRRIR